MNDVYGYISFEFKEGEPEEDEIVVEEWSSLQSEMPTGQGYSDGESVEILKMSPNEAGGQVLHYFLDYDPKIEDESYAERANMSIARLAAWIAIVIRRSVEKEKRKEQR